MSDPQQPPAQPHGTPPRQSYGTPAAQPYVTPPAGAYGTPPAGPYGTPPAGNEHPYPAPPAVGAATGRIAFILATASLVIGLVIALAIPAIVRISYDASLIGLATGVGNGLVLVAAAVALVLGLIAVRRPGSQVLAGIAIGIAAAEVLGIVVSWMSNLLFALAY